MFTRYCYPLALRVCSQDFCASRIFPSNGSSSRRSPSLIHRSGSLRSRFSCLRYYDCTTTAHCPSRSLLCLILPVLKVRSSFVSLFFSFASVLSEREDSPVYLYPALSVGGPIPPETMSPHTFPYDPLYICPALRPRPRRSHSLIVCPRPLPLF